MDWCASPAIFALRLGFRKPLVLFMLSCSPRCRDENLGDHDVRQAKASPWAGLDGQKLPACSVGATLGRKSFRAFANSRGWNAQLITVTSLHGSVSRWSWHLFCIPTNGRNVVSPVVAGVSSLSISLMAPTVPPENCASATG